MQAHLEAWRGDWALFLDGAYMNLGIEGESGPVELRVDSRFYQFEFGGLYRALRQDYRDGDGADEFHYKVTTQGTVVGVSYRF